MTTSELSFVDLNERVYKYIRQFTIKSAEDAAVELITNCVDAYNKGNILTSRKIEIEYNEPNTYNVRDFAIGLSGADMERCFLQVGDYTNVDGSRGFFSRGAKDISAIGDITFHSIKNGLYSRVYLNRDAYGRVEVVDEPVDQQIRELTGLDSENNGVLVSIKLLDNFLLLSPSDHATSLSKLGTLRDIMTDSANELYFIHKALDGVVITTTHLSYTVPLSTLLLDVTYNVPNYESVSATFKVYKTDKPIPQPRKENEMEFGFLIKDSSTVYEVCTIDDRFRWNPYTPYLYGSVSCDNIGTLLREYDVIGASTLNPVPIIDPSRLTGVNKSHPFIVSLLSIPKVRIDQILRELNQSISTQSISLNEVGSLFDELEKYGLNIVDTEDITMKFVPSYDESLAKAIEDDRINYVTSEKSYLLVGNYNLTQTQTDEWIEQQIIKISPVNPTEYSYIVDENNNLIQIPYVNNNPNSSTEIVDQLNHDDASNFTQRPYIYSIDSNGQLVKLYIFEKGRIEAVTNPENDYVVLKNRKFRISFINDINMEQRYIIETDAGIHVKLNVHNSMIEKYLVNDAIKAGATDLAVANITSVRSLIFLRELMTEILAEIIVENDVINNKLILDSNNYNNMKKIMIYRNKIVNRVEDPLEVIFDHFINTNYDNKKVAIDAVIASISTAVASLVDMDNQGGNLLLLKESLNNTISKVLE